MRFPVLSLTAAFALLTSQLAVAQRPAPPTETQKATARAQRIEYNACPLTAYCLDCGTTPAELTSTTLDLYFHQKLSPAQAQPLTGQVLVQIIVDTTGAVCCQSVQNLTTSPNGQIEALHLDQVVAAMPRWQPARTGSAAQKASATVRLTFNGSKPFYADRFYVGRRQPAKRAE